MDDINAEILRRQHSAIDDVLKERAKAAVDARNFDLDDLPTLFQRLKKETETAQVLIATSYLEDKVKTLLEFQMRDVTSKADNDRLFGSNSPLSTFGSRLTLSYQLGWLEKERLDEATCLRKIRNEFAHRAFEVNFSDEKISALFLPLEKALTNFYKATSPETKTHYKFKPLEELTPDERKTASMAFVITFVCMELLTRPEYQRLRVPYSVLTKKASEGPETVKAMLLNLIRSVRAIAGA